MAKRKTAKRKPRGNFLKRVQNTPRVKSIKKKIRDNESKRKKLSREYKRLIKSESKRLKKSR